MINRQYGRLVIQCDTCGASEESHDGESFQDFWARKKRDGWRAHREGDDWQHECEEHRVR